MLIQLKISCMMATVNPTLNFSGVLMCKKATSPEVRLVPMLEPITMGIASFTVMLPEATKATTNEVTVEEDCMTAVPRVPMRSPTAGLVRCSLGREPSALVEISRKPRDKVASEQKKV